jgi:hypothetical protein
MRRLLKITGSFIKMLKNRAFFTGEDFMTLFVLISQHKETIR